MIDDPQVDARLRALDPSPPEARDSVGDTDWGRALPATITSGTTGRVRRRARRALGIAAAAATAVAIAGLMTALFLSTGPGEVPVADGPAALVATPVPGGPEVTPESLRAAASIMVERAGLLGVAGVTAIPRGADVIDVTIPDGAPGDLLSQISAPGRLIMVPDLPVTGRSVLGLDAAVRTAQAAAGVPIRGGGEEALPDGFVVVREGPAGGDPVTSGYLVYRRILPVTDAAVGSAQTAPASSDPAVTVQFTPRGARAFTALTRRVAREGRTNGRLESVVIALDGRLITNADVDYEQYPDGFDGSSGTQIPIPGDLDAGVVAASLSSGALPLDLAPQRVVPGDDLVIRSYMGVSCSPANDPGCDRAGLSVTLRSPARSIDATIGGRTFPLDDPVWSGPKSGGTGRVFAGFLSPAGFGDGVLRIPGYGAPGFRWTGVPPVVAPVRLDIRRADGALTTMTIEVVLSPGWG